MTIPACCDHPDTCECGMELAAPFPTAKLSAAEWGTVRILLLTRSGGSHGRCEIGSPACLAGPGGDLSVLTWDQVSVHHRQPRGRGGTRNPLTNSLANLVLICGTGTTGCHGWVEAHRRWAYRTGWLVRHPVPGRPTADTDPARRTLLLPSGWQVLLHPTAAVPPTRVGFDVREAFPAA